MISTKALFNRNGKQAIEAAMEAPSEPVTVEGEQLAAEVRTFLAKAYEEQRALISEQDELGRQMAELLAAKEMGQPVDPEHLISIAERRSSIQPQIESVGFRVAGLQAQQAELEATEHLRQRESLLPRLEKSAELGESLLHQWYLAKCQESEILEALNANVAHFRSLTFDWNRASQLAGHGVTTPREVWDFYLPDVKRQATYPNPEGRRTLAQQVERTLYLDPQERREQFMRDHEKSSAQQEAIKLETHRHYLNFLQQKRIAETNGYLFTDSYEYVIPGEMKHLKSDLDWTGPR